MSATIPSIFSTFQEYLDSEQDIREEIRTSVKDIEQTAREILTVLQSIHQDGGIKEIPAICSRVDTLFQTVGTQFNKLATLIPNEHYYKYHDHWRFVIQRLTFLATLTEYLKTGKLASREEIAAIMGVKTKREDGFHLDLEDYLMGVLQLSSELSRFAVNSVTSGDYSRPLQISNFMAELSAGFRLLNLKNDNLRKRFDALKYDVKKVEEVVYDLTIRGLKPDTAAEATGDSATKEKA